MTPEDFRLAVRAVASFQVTNDAVSGFGSRVVIAEADTGSRYTVVITPLGLAGTMLGANVLVSVLHPWRSAYPLQDDGGELHSTYVLEKLCGGHTNAGDVAALTLTIGYAMNRVPVVDGLPPSQQRGTSDTFFNQPTVPWQD